MKTELVLYNSEKQKPFFELSHGTRPWGILLTVSKGSFEVMQNGETQSFLPFEIAYIPPNTEFSRLITEPIDFHQFSFYADKSDPMFLALRGGKLDIPKEQVRAIVKSAEKLTELCNAGKIAEHILDRIITENYLFGKERSEGSHKMSREIAAATEIIRSSLKERINISKLAASVGLSNAGLIWKFKKELSMTPSDYITMHRIKLAKALLLEGDMPISRIAEACGYANAYYFSNAFLKNTKMRPTAFREKYLV